jgi:predicted nucleotidyltransferase
MDCNSFSPYDFLFLYDFFHKFMTTHKHATNQHHRTNMASSKFRSDAESEYLVGLLLFKIFFIQKNIKNFFYFFYIRTLKQFKKINLKLKNLILMKIKLKPTLLNTL